MVHNGDPCWLYRSDLAGQAARPFDGLCSGTAGTMRESSAALHDMAALVEPALSACMRQRLLSQLPLRCHAACDKRTVWVLTDPCRSFSRPAAKYSGWAGGILQVGCFDATSFGQTLQRAPLSITSFPLSSPSPKTASCKQSSGSSLVITLPPSLSVPSRSLATFLNRAGVVSYLLFKPGLLFVFGKQPFAPFFNCSVFSLHTFQLHRVIFPTVVLIASPASALFKDLESTFYSI